MHRRIVTSKNNAMAAPMQPVVHTQSSLIAGSKAHVAELKLSKMASQNGYSASSTQVSQVSQVSQSQYNVPKPPAVAKSFNAPIGLLSTPSFAGNTQEAIGINLNPHQPPKDKSHHAQPNTETTLEEKEPTKIVKPEEGRKPLSRIPGPIGDIVRSEGSQSQSEASSQQTKNESAALHSRPWKEMKSLLSSLNRSVQKLENLMGDGAGYRAQALRVSIVKLKHLEAGAFAIVMDDSGQMEAEFHKDAIDMFPLSLVQGSCLYLENVSIFRPFDQYSCAFPQLIILPRNILRIFAPKPSCDVDLGLLKPLETSETSIPAASQPMDTHIASADDTLHEELVEAIKASQLVKTQGSQKSQKAVGREVEDLETLKEVRQMAMDTFQCSDDEEELENLFGSPEDTAMEEKQAQVVKDSLQLEEDKSIEKKAVAPPQPIVESKEAAETMSQAEQLSAWVDDEEDEEMENLF